MRYHRCCAPRYRVYKANVHNFRLTQLLYGSVTLARCAALPCRFILPPTTSRGFLSHSPMAVFINALLMYGAIGWASSKVMCGPHASLRSSVASHPTLPTPSYRLLSIDNTCTTLAGDGSSRYESCAR